MVEVLRDAGLSALFDADAAVEVLAAGYEFTEGPLWLPDGSVIHQDIKAERTYRIDPAGQKRVFRDHTGAANGQTFGPDGRIYFCEQNGRRISRMEPDGTGVETVVETYEGKRLNSPNDIVAHPAGYLAFTDPPYGAPPDRPLDFQGVFALDIRGDLRLLVAHDFEKPNGLAFTPDGRTLYVNDTAKYHTRAFDVAPDGTLSNDRVFCVQDPAEKGGPDGMKVDADGRVYVAVAQGVWVYEPGGKFLGIIAVPKRPANLAWCGPEKNLLVMTATDTVYRVKLKVQGYMPPFTPGI